jgi:hypothetical protein
MRHPKAGDRVRVKATGELGTLISTEEYNRSTRPAPMGRELTLRYWSHTRWVRFDFYSPKRPLVVGHTPSELEVISS